MKNFIDSYRYFFFDIDGVLLSTVVAYAELCKEITENLGGGKELDLQYYLDHIGEKFEYWLLPHLPEGGYEKLHAEFTRRETQEKERFLYPLVSGVQEFFTYLVAHNKKIVLISSKRREAIDAVIDHFDWREIVSYSVAGDEVHHFKPDPEGIEKALEYFDAGKHEVLFIGDSEYDLGAARNAGIDFIGVLTGLSTKYDWEKEGAEFVPSVADIKNLSCKKPIL